MQTYAIHYILLKFYIIGDEELCFITIIESSIGIADLRHNNPIKQSLNFISVTCKTKAVQSFELSVSHDDYDRNASCAPNQISTFF
jgi:hypothetical protein